MSPAFREQYDKAMAHDLNRLEINAHRRHPVTGQPYVPGSTIKGALRTALVAMRAEAEQGHKRDDLKQIADDRRRQGEFEPALFGRQHGEMHRDPFRALRVSDAVVSSGPPKPDGTPRPDPMIVGTITVRSLSAGAADREPGIPMQYEYVRGALMDKNLATTFECMVTFDKHAHERGKLAGAFEPPELAKAAHEFYLANLRRERERFMTPWGLTDRLKDLYDQAAALNPAKGQFLLRLGRFSHVENLTVRPPFRHAYSPQKRSEITEGSGRGLAEEAWPFGWVLCRFAPARP
jgi:hypothetical protein